MARLFAILLAGLGILDLAVIDIVLAPQVVASIDAASASPARTDVMAARASAPGSAPHTDPSLPEDRPTAAERSAPAPAALAVASESSGEAATDHAAEGSAKPSKRPAKPSKRPANQSDASQLPNLTHYALPANTRRIYNLQFPLVSQDWVPAQAKSPLETIARRIVASPRHRAIVRGHADARGSRSTNLELATVRARVIADHLVSLGVPRERLETRALGETRPAVNGHNTHAWFRNRRVEVVLEPQSWSRR